MTVFEILFLIVAYFIGGLPLGYWFLKHIKHVDLKTIGSGNIGATNAYRAGGWSYAIPVWVLDVIKGATPTLISLAFFPQLTPYIIFFTLLGNVFSPYLGFKGGKGIGTSAGILLPVFPITIICTIIGILLLIRITKVVSISSLAGALITTSWLLYSAPDNAYRLGTLSMLLLIIFAHRSNISRIISRKEKKITRNSHSKEK